MRPPVRGVIIAASCRPLRAKSRRGYAGVEAGTNPTRPERIMTDFTTVADGLRFPEGPVAMPDGSIILVEIKAGRITRISAEGAKHVVATPGGGPNGLAMGPDGWLYCCNNGGFNY